MITIFEHQTQVIQKILQVNNDSILSEIDEILKKNEIIGHTSSGKPLTQKEYIEHIESISNSIKNGAKTFSGKEVKNFVLKHDS